MSDAPKPWWASLLAGLLEQLKAWVAPIAAYFAGRKSTELQVEKEARREAETEIARSHDVAGARADDAERARVRDKFKDPT